MRSVAGDRRGIPAQVAAGRQRPAQRATRPGGVPSSRRAPPRL